MVECAAAKSDRLKSLFLPAARPRFRQIKRRGPARAARRCGGLTDGFHEYLALDRGDRRRAAAVRRGKISELMGDVAQGIKAFKKGMSEDETAKVEPPKTEPVKTLDHQAERTPASTAKSQAKSEPSAATHCDRTRTETGGDGRAFAGSAGRGAEARCSTSVGVSSSSSASSR